MRQRILYIGDLHGCFMGSIEQLIEELEPDLTIFLGDYFDHFGDTPESTARMALWLAGSIEKGNRIHLVGNHDLPYLTGGLVNCPGYTPEKARYVMHELDLDRWRKCSHTYYWAQPDLLVSHAGLSCTLLDELDIPPARTQQWLAKEFELAWQNLADPSLPQIHPFWRVGSARSQGTTLGCGGLTWCDWDHDFEPIPGINQILGHTPGPGVRIKTGYDDRLNFCIDTCDPHGAGPRQCLLWQHGQYEVLTLGKKYHAL